MGKWLMIVIMILVLVLSTGCDLFPSNAPQDTPVGPSLDELSTLSAFTTQANSAPVDIPELPTLTLTPEQGGLGQGGEQEPATVTPNPINTSMPGSIKITSITQKSPGVAIIKWEAVGDFPSGFKIVFTDQQSQPTYPENSYASVYSSTARAGVINYTADRIYYVRVCRFLVNTCDIYSDLGIFAYAPPTKTPRPTRTPAVVNINGTDVPFDSTLVITQIKGGADGKAYFEWKDTTSNTKPYKIVYSTTSSLPTLGTDSYFSIGDPKTRFAYVTGKSATKYNYRICRYDGKTCTSYSAVYAFTFPTYTISTPVDTATIAISTITNTGVGTAQVNWTATGTFDNGFKILYSKTNTSPTLSDSVTVVSDGTARAGSIIGDPSTLYYVRVCKYSGTACTVYSPVVNFTFDADPIVINLSSVENGTAAGTMDLTWSISGGTTPNGFKILMSTEAIPDLTNSTLTAAADGATTATISGSSSTSYYLSVCKWLGSTCGPYSNFVAFTTDAD